MTSLLYLSEEQKKWSKKLNLDGLSFNSANDFELALLDYSYLSDKTNKKYKENFKNLNWFIFDTPSLYTNTLDNFVAYLTFVIITKLYSEDYTIKQYETYFTNQIVSFLQSKKDYKNMVNISYINSIWTNVLKVLTSIVNTTDKDNLISNTSCYFTCHKDQYKVTIPITNIDQKSESIIPTLVLSFYSKKPCWYTVPSLYKIYQYYSYQDILIKKLNIVWLDLSDNSNFIYETIPTTENVAKFVSNYFNISPFPFPNVFNKQKSSFYTQSPISSFI